MTHYEGRLETLDDGSRTLDLAGAATLPELERKADPVGIRDAATCECLSLRGTLDNLERRHAEDALGQSTDRDFPVHARSAVVTAHELMDPRRIYARRTPGPNGGRPPAVQPGVRR